MLYDMKNNVFIVIITIGFMIACKEESQLEDHTPPGEVSNIEVENIPGGAILRYVPPHDEDLLYVAAVYSLKDGVSSEARASLYNDTVKIEGFGDTAERQVQLIAVDRSGNKSQAVNAAIAPLEPPVKTIGATLDLIPDFGGVHAYWQNPTRAEIGVIILMEDQNKEYVPLDAFYSSMKSGEGATKGMDTIPRNFGIYAQDRWGNMSEIKYYTHTPIFETKFDRSKFNMVELPGDAPSSSGWVMPRMWDDIMGNQGFSSPGGGGAGSWPHSITMDLGVIGKLSRLRLFQRQEPYVFAEGNPRKFQVWGAEVLDPSGNWSSWTKLMDCESIKPSGLPIGQNTAEDVARSHDGEDFNVPPTAPKVRYIRIKVTQTWAGGDNFQISELQFFGDNRQ
jgi:hypothetical protein